MLTSMRRYYSREAYLNLVEAFRNQIPKIAISSDFIAGFCGESESQFQDTLTLIETVGYDMAYLFAYSLREKTHAHYKLTDDVDEITKKRRLNLMIDSFRKILLQRNLCEINSYHIVLVEGNARKSTLRNKLVGRTDTNKLCIFPDLEISKNIPEFLKLNSEKNNNYKGNNLLNDIKEIRGLNNKLSAIGIGNNNNDENSFSDLYSKIINDKKLNYKSLEEIKSEEENFIRKIFLGEDYYLNKINVGDYVIVKINDCSTNTLFGTPVCKVNSLKEYFDLSNKEPYFKLQGDLDNTSIYNFCEI